MKKYFYFLLTLLIFETLAAESTGIEPKNPQIGRYQLTTCSKGREGWPQLYLLDTTTGEVWRSCEKNSFMHSYKEWTPIVAPIEQEIAE